MIRVLNIAFLAVTGLVCLGLYRIAEEARIAAADLKTTETAIARENESLTVLGAEWARLTQPARIQALAQHQLDLSDRPAAELASLTQLPPKNLPLAPQGTIRNANATVPQSTLRIGSPVASGTPSARLPAATFALIHTGT